MRGDTPILLTLFLLLAWGCERGRATPPAATTTSPPPNAEWFSDRAEESGLHFVHFNGMSGDLHHG